MSLERKTCVFAAYAHLRPIDQPSEGCGTPLHAGGAQKWFAPRHYIPSFGWVKQRLLQPLQMVLCGIANIAAPPDRVFYDDPTWLLITT